MIQCQWKVVNRQFLAFSVTWPTSAGESVIDKMIETTNIDKMIDTTNFMNQWLTTGEKPITYSLVFQGVLRILI